MKIVFIQPKAYKHNPSFVCEPLNLGYLSAYLRQNGYNDISIRISAFESEDDIIAEASVADIVGITSTSPMMTNGRKLAGGIKKQNKNSIIVFGGTHASVLPESTLEDENIDVVVRGEGEVTFYRLVQAVEQNTPFESVAGISYRDGGVVVNNPDREKIKDVTALPFPARDLMHQEDYIRKNAGDSDNREAWILASRGCPFHCTYCASNQVWSRLWRFRSPENIVDEMQALVEGYKVKQINFADDTFTVNRGHVQRFCEVLRQRNINIPWACNVHVNTADKDMFMAMKAAGCKEIWIGVESGSPTILKELDKGSSLEKIRNAFRWSDEAGLVRHAYLLIGAPSETYETIRETEKLISEIKPDRVGVTIVTPYPGTALFHQAKIAGHVEDNQDWSLVDLHFSVTMPTKYMTKEQLLKEHDRLSKAVRQYYKTKPELNLLSLIKLILQKLKTTSFFEYSKLIRGFLFYLKSHK